MSKKIFHCLSALKLIAFICLFNLGSADDTPSWAETGKHPRYPSSLFILGVGTAMDPTDAEAKALSSIARQIQANVQTASKSNILLVSDSLNSMFSQSVTVDSSQTINGAKFVERFQNKEHGWTVLAVAKIADILAARQQDAMRCFESSKTIPTAQNTHDQAISASETFRNFIKLHRARIECGKKYADFRSIESLSRTSSVLSHNAPPNTMDDWEAKLASNYFKYHSQLQSLSFKSICDGKVQSGQNMVSRGSGFHAGFCDDIEKIFVAVGLKKKTDSASFEIKVSGLAREKLAPHSSLAFVQSKVSIDIFDSTNHSYFFKTTADTDAGGANLDAALAKADEKLVAKFTESFLNSF